MDIRRLLVASMLSLVVVLVWPLVFPSASPPPEPLAESSAQPAAATGISGAPQAGASFGPAGAVTTADSAAAPAALPGPTTAADSSPLVPGDLVLATSEELVVVETPTARIGLSNRGGVMVSYQAKRLVGGREVQDELVRSRPPEAAQPFALLGADDQPVDAALAVVERAQVAEGEEVVFRQRRDGVAIEKRFVFRPDGLFSVAVRTSGLGPWRLMVGPGLRNPSADQATSQFAGRLGVWSTASGDETTVPAKADQPVPVDAAGLRFAGLEDTFFVSAVVPLGGLARATFVAVNPPGATAELPPGATPTVARKPTKEERARRDFRLELTPQANELSVLAYFGAKDYERLVAQGLGLEETVRWGMFGAFARPLLWGLQWIYDRVVSNYGWAIVLLTVLIKLVLLPLTHKSYVSMQKMAALNPKMQAIRAGYRTKLRDKNGRMNVEAQQKMNQEIMALYQREGVNPASGCLPILLQFPVLIAFYNLLSTAVELHGAPWVGWITDLSAHDPYYVLPIVMGGTQFLQTKMTPMTGDPMQRRIFLMLPLVFTVLFLGFPSGLVLYWLTNNVLTVLQTWIYNTWRERQNAAAA